MNLISVIIPTRNRSNYVVQAINSILSINKEDFEIEIIVIDDGSTDSTPDILQLYPVRYFRSSGQGASAARNRGIAEAHGDFISFLDDDDIWTPHNLISQMKMFEIHPNYGAICSQMVLADQDLNPCAGPFPMPPLPSGWIFNELFGHIPVAGTLLIRNSVLQAVGGFDITLHGAEDWDLALRIARQYPIGFVEDVALICRQHQQSRQNGVQQKQTRDEDITWRRYLDVIKVSKYHTKELPLRQRILLQRKIFKWRGYFVPQFMQYAKQYSRKGDITSAIRCLTLAARASFLHTLAFAIKYQRVSE
jgi:glycosyltransferase involved in cell wall biosynthesis